MYRVSMTPLYEESSNNIREDEITVNRITGHITFKHKDRYISKTKELDARVCELDENVIHFDKEFVKLKKDTDITKIRMDNVERDLDSITNELTRLENEIKIMKERVNRNIETMNHQYDEIDRQYDKILELNDEVGSKNPIIVDFERQLDEFKFLDNEIRDWHTHINNRINNPLRPYHDKNIELFNNTVTKQEYLAFKSEIEGKYRGIGVNYTLTVPWEV